MKNDLVRKRSGWRVGLIAGLCLAAILLVDVAVHGRVGAEVMAGLHLHALHPLEHVLWDAEPYASGIDRYNAGESPYILDDLTNLLPFAYPPAFVWVGGFLARGLGSPWGWRVYAGVYWASVFLLQMMLAGIFLGRVRWARARVLVCLVPLVFLLSVVFLSGNLHMIWYCLAALAAVDGVKRQRWVWFYGVALLAMLSQPVFLSLLLIPVFTGGALQMYGSVGTVVLAGLGYLAEKMLRPELWRQFQTTVANHPRASHDFGQGVFGIVMHWTARLGGGTGLAMGIQLLFCAAIAGVLVWARPRCARDPLAWWGVLALAVVLADPRIMPYDAAVGLVPAIFFFARARESAWLWGGVAAAVGLCVVGHGSLGLTPLMFAGFVVGILSVAKSGGELDVARTERVQRRTA